MRNHIPPNRTQKRAPQGCGPLVQVGTCGALALGTLIGVQYRDMVRSELNTRLRWPTC